MIVRLLLVTLCVVPGILQVSAADLIVQGSSWKYAKGLSEASSPASAWRAREFGDDAWLAGDLPVYYGEDHAGTLLDDMPGQYSSVFLRKTFLIGDPAGVSELQLETLSDDGFIAWINGTEVARYNMPDGEIPVFGASLGALAEPIPWETTPIANASEFLVPGTNMLAVHAFNTSLSGSSDFVFDARLSSVEDVSPPGILEIIPAEGALVRSLSSIEFIFSETVDGVEASDLVVNGVPPQRVSSFVIAQ
jgi:hypothetical protein